MTQNPTPQILTQANEKARKQSDELNDIPTLPKVTPDASKAVQESMKPRYPDWPTSKPGPRSTPPPPGMRPINAMRSEQVAEVGYNQEAGVPSTLSPARSMPDESQTGPTSFDQTETAQEALKKRKERL